MRFLVECTYVYDHPHVNSGIQRVVRNVINHLDEASEGVECVPVIIKNGKTYQVNRLQPAWPDKRLSNMRQRLDKILNAYWMAHYKLEQTRLLQSSLNLRRLTHVLFKLASLIFMVPLAAVVFTSRNFVDGDRAIELDVKDDDVLVLLDSSWHYNYFDYIENLKKRGVKVVGVLYDLIPLTHPQFCDEHLVNVFERWFEWIGRTADGFICISETIRDQLRGYVLEKLGQEQHDRLWFESFYLGSELDLGEKDGEVSSKVSGLFNTKQSVYLMVSTIEPRKNHAYLLDAFEQLWAQGIDAQLCIVGRIGWKCESLVERIKHHEQLGKQLFMFNDLDDNELDYCYKHAKCLLFPSFVEGFGLPIVEAMQRDLNIMASDIPVFREVGGEAAAYFDLDDVTSLSQLIIQYENTGQFPGDVTQAQPDWLTWLASTKQFLSRIRTNLASA